MTENTAMAQFQKLSDDCTEYSNRQTTMAFQVFQIDKDPQAYSQMRYYWLKTQTRKLANNNKSVEIIDAYLREILCRSDALQYRDDPKKFYDIVLQKFIIVNDLAASCNLPVERLLRYASPRIFSNITSFLLTHEGVQLLIEQLLGGLHFFKEHILPRSWFHLLTVDEATGMEPLSNESLQRLLKYRNTADGRETFSLSQIKLHLYVVISKIATTQKLSQTQKRSQLQVVKKVFGFENDHELLILYNGDQFEGHKTRGSRWFESMVLIQIQESLGLSRKHFMEQLLMETEPNKILRHYHIPLFWECFFFKIQTMATPAMIRQSEKIKAQVEKVVGALEFLAKQLKKETSMLHSDLGVCWLEALHVVYPKWFDAKYSVGHRQSALFSFTRLFELLISRKLFEGYECTALLEEALIQKALFVLRHAQHDDTVEMSIFSLQHLLNLIKIQKTLSILPQVFSLVTHAQLNYSHRPKIMRYAAKIFEYYICGEKKRQTIEYWPQIQFIMLAEVANSNEKIQKVVQTVSAELYCTSEQIERSLRALLKQISCSCEDIRILAVRYILEILEQKTPDDIRRTLCKPEMLQVVHSCILELKQSSNSQKSVDFGVICAKVIAFIGLCHPFVTDPILLKANNQSTIRQGELNGQSSKSETEVITTAQSERVNPVTNMAYYKQQSVDNTLELLAVPSLSKLPLERDRPIVFATKLREIIGELTQLNEQKPKNYYFAQFLLTHFIKTHGGDERRKNTRGDQIMQDPYELAQTGGPQAESDHAAHQREVNRFSALNKTVKRFAGITKLSEKAPVLAPQGGQAPSLDVLTLFLISKIDDPQWKEIFEACIPLVRKSIDMVELVLPYLVYFTLRHQAQDELGLAEQLSHHLNQILASENSTNQALALSLLEFLKIAVLQDKKLFKQFLEESTHYKYSDKLFNMDIVQPQDNPDIQKFIQILNQNVSMKKSFLVVRRCNHLLAKIEKQHRNQAAKSVRNLKRCLYNMEDTYRQTVLQSTNSGFMDNLPPEDVIEIVRVQKQLFPEEFDSPLFNQIIHNDRAHAFESVQFNNAVTTNKLNQSPVKMLQAQLNFMFKSRNAAKDWKEGNWQSLVSWMGDLDLNTVLAVGRQLPFIIPLEAEDKIMSFELILGMIFAELYRASQHLLRSNDFTKSDAQYSQYLTSLEKTIGFIEFLYFEFIFTLEAQQGELSAQYKLFLHVLYEIQTAIVFVKDVFWAEAERVCEHLKKEVNRNKRSFDKVYLECNFNSHFERLLAWLEDRFGTGEASPNAKLLVMNTRLALFTLWEREQEIAFYKMKLAKLHRKQNENVLTISRCFKECDKLQHRLVDFEYEYCKYLLQTKNAHEAYVYLTQKLEKIREKQDQMQKWLGAAWMPRLVWQKAQLLELQLLIRLDPRNAQIFDKFTNFVKSIDEIKETKWEKPYFLFAQYIDLLERNLPTPKFERSEEKERYESERNRRHIQRIFYYVKSVSHGHKYIWQSLPRALELWFDYYKDQNSDPKITTFMRQELKKLESYKIATVLQLLLSRFGHERKEVRDTIVDVLSQLAVAYPEHCAWWIFHFHFFEDARPAPAQSKKVITRGQFSDEILQKILKMDIDASRKIMESETLFGDLKKLSEKEVKEVKQGETTMEMPKQLSNIQLTTNLVMPIEENLTPQLPPLKIHSVHQIKALVSTSAPITKHVPQNLGGAFAPEPAPQIVFPAYKPNPIKIQSFLPKIQIMSSKEKPKKISIVGTNGQVYYFLLKCDKTSDLRKEQRFIDFAMLCNKMLQQDPQAHKRGLRLRTYSIVPLSRHTGMIEWIKNTSTLKYIVSDQWKRANVRVDMTDVKKLATASKKGDSHSDVWPEVKKLAKPMLAEWFTEHFPSPDLWYEARVNFVKSCAIWSMIGYVIGLGDRHGDNILVHLHTGEVTHVDFDCIFEKGARLKVPEIVPFRLTANIMDAFGIFREKGIFQKCCEVVLRVLRKNQKNILSYLDSFKHDPVIECSSMKTDIKSALEVIENKLQGNVSIGSGSALTVEEQVEQVILNAINDESLRKMYVGWMPWL